MSDDYRAALAALKKLTGSLEAAETARLELRKELARLQKQGLTNAKAHWRGGKYLYLIHPKEPGEEKRKREYVGIEEAKVKEALDRIERTRLYEAKASELAHLDRYVSRMAEGLNHLTYFSYD